MILILSLLCLFIYVFIDIKIFINCLIGFIGVYFVFLLIFFISKGGIGLGDMFYLGLFASCFGYLFTITAFVLSFWIATIVLIFPFIIGRIDKKTKIPFIPFLFIGCFISICTGIIINLIKI